MMNTLQQQSWLCFQLGAREHYAIPRALHAQGLLAGMVTDLWVPPSHPLRFAPVKALRQRWHPALADAHTKAWNWPAVLRAACQRKMKVGWDRTIATNTWFGDHAADWLKRHADKMGGRPVVFSYSYTAAPVFEVAKSMGCVTILGQTNGGPAEEQRVRELHERYPGSRSSWRPAPTVYWESWRREIQLADHIVVNSDWSKSLLIEEGAPADRVVVIPLAYSPPASARGFERVYPVHFDSSRPMRVLFLGQLNLRKGVMLLLEVARRLKDNPVEFVLVGPDHVGIENEIRGMSNVRCVGPVSRMEVEMHYRDADVFLFPTHSDGFGLTQLEAQAWRLPLVVSKHCGAVAIHETNGLVIEELTGEGIAQALLACMNDPGKLRRFSNHAVNMTHYGMDALGEQLLNLDLPQAAEFIS